MSLVVARKYSGYSRKIGSSMDPNFYHYCIYSFLLRNLLGSHRWLILLTRNLLKTDYSVVRDDTHRLPPRTVDSAPVSLAKNSSIVFQSRTENYYRFREMTSESFCHNLTRLSLELASNLCCFYQNTCRIF